MGPRGHRKAPRPRATSALLRAAGLQGRLLGGIVLSRRPCPSLDRPPARRVSLRGADVLSSP